MKGKRFQKMRVVDNVGTVYDSQTDDVLGLDDMEHKLNEQYDMICMLTKRLRLMEYQLRVQDRIIDEYEKQD